MQRETFFGFLLLFFSFYFNPLPLCRGRLYQFQAEIYNCSFQSSPSMQRETAIIYILLIIYVLFQSSPSMQRETHYHRQKQLWIRYFNPLPLCRGRQLYNLMLNVDTTFPSSPSMQRETMEQIYALLDATNFNPLPLCRGRPYEKSIDVTLFSFQSSPSMQRETL